MGIMLSKSVLLVKQEYQAMAIKVFAGTDVKISTDGCRYLGATLGTDTFIKSFLDCKAQALKGEMEQLCRVAETQPQAAYTAYTQGLKNTSGLFSAAQWNLQPLPWLQWRKC